MKFKALLGLSALALMVWLYSAATAEAEEPASSSEIQQPWKSDSGTPPQPAPNALPGTENPVPEGGTTAQAACISETGDYETHGAAVTFVIGLENKCDQPLKCKIYANVSSPKGNSLGQATLVLGARSSGAAAKKTYAMRVKAAGGIAQVSRECGVF